MSPTIAIVGAGPAGLLAGVILQKHNVPFTVYELRSKPTDEEFAQPSGMLDLHEESGLAALAACDLTEVFHTFTGECAEDQKIADKNGKILYQDEGNVSNRPEISRHNLTKMLLDTVSAPTTIHWNHKLVSVTETPNGTELDFGENGKHTYDLVIGADGAWSKVRKALTDVKPAYAGTQYLVATIRNATEKYPHLAQLVGKGSFSSLANHHGVMTQRGPQDSIRVMVVVTTDDEQFATTKGFAGKPATHVIDTLLSDDSLLGSWGSLMKELVKTACTEEEADHPGQPLFIRPLYSIAAGTSWETKPGYTVIGDAAHVMCPWAGEGVNLAMNDAMILAQAICKAVDGAGDAAAFKTEMATALPALEKDMMQRWEPFAEETIRNGNMLFGSENGSQSFVDFFKQFMPPEAFVTPE
ncbi:hypothetical protein VHEMI00085 [[Torrubiella] hemipterigena]|uniref:FAD-binding domain-containing protein n=1 Tax=[Torrubiella] hemipterigena TaxID=1531966 RepID=A0A0A1T169_9HYPO|nr:hypothetical protein VHEMI00085 [[Torrubiella] hemipterigena]